MQFNEYDKEREQIILHHFIYRGLKDGGGGGGGFENCAYLWKNSGYAPELFFQDNPRLTKQFHHMQLTGALFFTYSSPLKYCTL